MAPTTIAIVGAGRVGSTLGRRWAESGHTVRFGVRDPSDEKHGPRRDHGHVAEVAAAVDGAAVVLLAVPWTAVGRLTAETNVADSTIVVDATNPLAAGLRDHDRDPHASGAEQIAAAWPTARIVKAFNTTGSGNMADSGYPMRPMIGLAGDDDEAKEVTAALAEQLGFDPVDVGPLTAARDLEHLAMIWIRLAYSLGHGPDIAFSLMRR